jgi:hypothetical protein
MKDKRIWSFKRRAEEDNLISAGACRLILRIASWRYCTKHHPADSEFALSWRDMASWYDLNGPETIRNKQTVYNWLNELVLHRYLFPNELKGSPPKRCYRLDLNYQPSRLALFDWAAENGREVYRPIGGKINQLIGGKINQLIGGKIPPPHNRYSFQEEMLRPKGKKSSGAHARRQEKGGGNNQGSLRSRRKVDLPLGDGQDANAVPISELPVEDRATQGCDLSATAETGGTKTPGRGRKAPASLPHDWQKMKKEAGL